MSIEPEWQVHEYAQDIHYYLRTKERKRFIYREQSPQLSMRKNLVEWMSVVCERMKFCKSVQHLGVYLLDIFLDNHSVHADHLKLVTLGCLIVAVKLEERDSLIPPNSDFNALIGNKYNLIDFYHMERTVLKFFNWDILFPTAAHFVEYYASHAHSLEDCHKEEPLSNYENLKLYFQKYLDYFLEASLKDIVFHKFYPSLVAASCILSTRLCLGLAPPWPLRLQNVTYYKYAEMKPCVDIFLRAINTEVVIKKADQICALSHSNKSSGDSISENSDCTLGS